MPKRTSEGSCHSRPQDHKDSLLVVGRHLAGIMCNLARRGPLGRNWRLLPRGVLVAFWYSSRRSSCGPSTSRGAGSAEIRPGASPGGGRPSRNWGRHRGGGDRRPGGGAHCDRRDSPFQRTRKSSRPPFGTQHLASDCLAKAWRKSPVSVTKRFTSAIRPLLGLQKLSSPLLSPAIHLNCFGPGAGFHKGSEDLSRSSTGQGRSEGLC